MKEHLKELSEFIYSLDAFRDAELIKELKTLLDEWSKEKDQSSIITLGYYLNRINYLKNENR